MKTIQIYTWILVMATSVGSASAKIVNIPDANFKAELILQEIDTNGDGEIQESEALNVISMIVFQSKIKSLEGIQYFKNLQYLDCSYNQLTTLNLTGLSNLKMLFCDGNQLTTLDPTEFPELTDLDCSVNQLTTLDLTGLSNLLYLNCSSNQLTTLNLTGLPKLIHLYCSSNQLTTLNLTGLSNLFYLECARNQLTTLNVTGLSFLRDLDCSSNQLTTLNLTGLPDLSELTCSSNQLTTLNLTGLSDLSKLTCSENQLTTLNLAGLSKLSTLICPKNQLTTLDLSGLPELTYLYCYSNLLTTLNLTGFSNLKSLDCYSNLLTSLDLTGLPKLYTLICSENQLTTLNLTELSNLKSLDCHSNQLTTLDLTGLPKLRILSCSSNQLTTLNLAGLSNLSELTCSENQLTTLDVSATHQLTDIFCSNNSNLEAIYFDGSLLSLDPKVVEGQVYYHFEIFENVPNLKYICAKNLDINAFKETAQNYGYGHVIINSFCTNTYEDAFYTVSGNAKLDDDNNGCDASDTSFPNLKIKISNDTDTDYLIPGLDGNYSIQLNAGNYTLKPIIESTNYYNISPESTTISLPDTVIPNFCITPNGVHPDLSVAVIPLRAARPGFSNASYKVVYKNQGNTTQSGTLTFRYNEDSSDFVSSTPVADQADAGLLTFNFSNLAPFESRTVLITMRTNAPTDNPAVNSGDVLEFTAAIVGAADETPDDNLATLNQTVVGSFDPNDKTCLQGDIITPDLVGKRIDYLIRFENTGTADAENIVITDYIDTSVMDVSSLLVTDASHVCHTQISQGNKVQFIFSDIQLPFTEPDKHGYVAFSIKLKDHLQVGDSIKNQADIYFDYNLPITTNVSKSEINYHVITSMYTQKISSAEMSVYPNPSGGNFSVEFKSKESKAVQFSVLDATGKTVYTEQYPAQHSNIIPINIHHLAKGTYLIRAQMEEDVISKQVVVQ